MEALLEFFQDYPGVAGAGGFGGAAGFFYLAKLFLTGFIIDRKTGAKEAVAEGQKADADKEQATAIRDMAAVMGTLAETAKTAAEANKESAAAAKTAAQANQASTQVIQNVAQVVAQIAADNKAFQFGATESHGQQIKAIDAIQQGMEKVATQMTADDMNTKIDRALAILERLESLFMKELKPEVEVVKGKVIELDKRMGSAEGQLAEARSEMLDIKKAQTQETETVPDQNNDPPPDAPASKPTASFSKSQARSNRDPNPNLPQNDTLDDSEATTPPLDRFQVKGKIGKVTDKTKNQDKSDDNDDSELANPVPAGG